MKTLQQVKFEVAKMHSFTDWAHSGRLSYYIDLMVETYSAQFKSDSREQWITRLQLKNAMSWASVKELSHHQIDEYIAENHPPLSTGDKQPKI